ncbi:MAG TPA: IPExxxVDY family protein [Cyclobacteriaceae bacterium]|nr:IPExxxVDY family protein [Cyclobacteriaceae bacterium]
MKKKRLDIDYTFDFDLYGIISTMKGYKLAWELNHALGCKLVKSDDYEVVNKKKAASNYLHYTQASEVNALKLFRNKPNEESGARDLLVPDHPHFDFILLAHGEAFADSNRLQELLRNIPSVELVAFIPLAALKTKEYFIF